MSSLHFIETFDNKGGGVPRVAQAIQHFFKEDLIVPVLEMSLLSALRKTAALIKSGDHRKNVFVHNIYCPRAIILGLIGSVFCRARLFVTPHGATNFNLVRGSAKKRLYLKALSVILRPFVYRYHFLNQGEATDSYLNSRAKTKSVIFSYPILIPEGDVPIRRGDVYNDKLRISFFSRVEKRKGILNLLTAVDQLNAEHFKIHLDIFGPIETSEIRQAINTVSSASYHGMVSLYEYIRFLDNIDIFCLPSFGEAHSLALMEHILLGLPCLVSREANSPPADGVLVYGRFDDIDALKAGIRKLSAIRVREAASTSNLDFGRQYNATAVRTIKHIVG